MGFKFVNDGSINYGVFDTDEEYKQFLDEIKKEEYKDKLIFSDYINDQLNSISYDVLGANFDLKYYRKKRQEMEAHFNTINPIVICCSNRHFRYYKYNMYDYNFDVGKFCYMEAIPNYNSEYDIQNIIDKLNIGEYNKRSIPIELGENLKASSKLLDLIKKNNDSTNFQNQIIEKMYSLDAMDDYRECFATEIEKGFVSVEEDRELYQSVVIIKTAWRRDQIPFTDELNIINKIETLRDNHKFHPNKTWKELLEIYNNTVEELSELDKAILLHKQSLLKEIEKSAEQFIENIRG